MESKGDDKTHGTGAVHCKHCQKSVILSNALYVYPVE